MFDQTLSNLIVCLIISQKLHIQKFHKRAVAVNTRKVNKTDENLISVKDYNINYETRIV